MKGKGKSYEHQYSFFDRERGYNANCFFDVGLLAALSQKNSP
jgi:hypothetical protein